MAVFILFELKTIFYVGGEKPFAEVALGLGKIGEDDVGIAHRGGRKKVTFGVQADYSP